MVKSLPNKEMWNCGQSLGKWKSQTCHLASVDRPTPGHEKKDYHLVESTLGTSPECVLPPCVRCARYLCLSTQLSLGGPSLSVFKSHQLNVLGRSQKGVLDVLWRGEKVCCYNLKMGQQWEHLPLLQRAKVWFPAPTWWFRTIWKL